MSTPKKTPAKQPTIPAAVVAVLDTYQAAITEAREAFEAQVKQDQADWVEELSRKKEQDLYEYNKQKRDREDQLDEELNDRTKDVAAREDLVTGREDAIGKVEAELADLRKLREDLPAKLTLEFAKGEKAGAAATQKEAATAAKLVEAQTAADVHILEHKLTTALAENAKKDETIEALLAQLNSANSRVENIATNAVQAAGQSKVTVQNGPQGK